MSEDLITLPDVTVENETELAFLVCYEDKTYWVPKSHCWFEDGNLNIPFWMAESKGMI